MKKIAIIGAGFSGTMCAVHLLEQSQTPIHLFLIDKKDFGRGIAYAENDECLLLNVRAENMSAYPDKPNHFYEWLKSKNGDIRPDEFISRKTYGDYLNSILHKAKEKSISKLELINDEVINISDALLFKTRDPVFADDIIIAAGLEFNPVDFKMLLENPSEPITIIGTGLSMVDLVVYLEKNNFQGKINAVSRHGRLPAPHVLYDKIVPRPVYTFRPATTLSEVFATVKIDLKKFEWRLVIDALRPHSQKLWKEFSLADKKQFLRHCRSVWDVHRHRMSPEHKIILESKIADGSLKIIKAGFKKYQPETKKVIELKGLAFDSTPGLIHTLILNKMIKKDKLSLGLECAPDGKLNSVPPYLYTLGPLRRGELWECTAVPEIRVQADALAKLISKT